MTNKKRLIALILTVVLVLAVLATVLIVHTVRDRRPPDLESLRPRIIALVESSAEVNEILFGKGLPTYPRVYQQTRERVAFPVVFEGQEYNRYYYLISDETYGTVLAYQYCLPVRGENNTYRYIDIEHDEELATSEVGKYRYCQQKEGEIDGALYYSAASGYSYIALPDYEEEQAEWYYLSTDEPYYDYVRFDCGYLCISDIKDRAQKVYAMSYLNSVYESLFTGIFVSDRDTGTLYARYLDVQNDDGDSYLLKSNRQEGFNVHRVYDFDTMKMVQPSNANYVNITVETYLEGDEEHRMTVRLSLTKQNGEWFLDSPTY